MAYMTPENESRRDVLLAAFSSRLSCPPSLADEEWGLVGARLENMLETGRVAFPAIDVPIVSFGHYLGDLVSGEESDLLRALSELHASDLYLVAGCLENNGAALKVFESTHLAGVGKFVKAIGAGPAFVDELRQCLRDRLFVSDSQGATTKISTYRGRGPLRNWLAVIAQRMALDLSRKNAKSESDPPDDVAAFGDPELEYLRSRYRLEFQSSFREALETLSERDRLILKLNIVSGVSFGRIAVMYQVNQSTVSRWARSAREAVREEVQRLMAERLGLARDELVSLVRVLQSDLDMSISQVLGTEVVSP
jgi:RNA polymerase sigma-70 factor (ECF subfamily)